VILSAIIWRKKATGQKWAKKYTVQYWKSWQKSFFKVSKDESSTIFLNNSSSVARKNIFIWKSLNMVFLRFLLVINLNIPAWAMLGDLLERQVSSSVFNLQVLNVTQEFFVGPVFL
jgi:hypothetical protein